MSERSRKDLDILARSALDMLAMWAKHFARYWSRIPERDFYSAGNEAIGIAALKYPTSPTRPFPRFARPFVVGAMYKCVRLTMREHNAQLDAIQLESLNDEDPNDDAYRARMTARWKAMEAGTDAATTQAAKEMRLKLQRMAAMYLVTAPRPLSGEALVLEREETERAVAVINRVLESFRPYQREALRLNRLEGITMPEISARLGIPQRTVERCFPQVEAALKAAFVEAGIETPDSVSDVWFYVFPPESDAA